MPFNQRGHRFKRWERRDLLSEAILDKAGVEKHRDWLILHPSGAPTIGHPRNDPAPPPCEAEAYLNEYTGKGPCFLSLQKIGHLCLEIKLPDDRQPPPESHTFADAYSRAADAAAIRSRRGLVLLLDAGTRPEPSSRSSSSRNPPLDSAQARPPPRYLPPHPGPGRDSRS
jgi:hypothetical protein